MRQRYIDFVPTAKRGDGATGEGADFDRAEGGKTASVSATGARSARKMIDGVARPQRKTTDGVVRAPAAHKVTRTVTTGAAKVATADVSAVESGFSIVEKSGLGVIEDLNARFVKTEVSKRPLSRGHFSTKKDEVSAVKAEKVGNKAGKSKVGVARATGGAGVRTEAGATGAGATKIGAKKTSETTYVPPRGKFINQAKVEKRPLSKNVYTKKIVAPKEEPKGPVTIITKPEKQSHVGLIVTIILTIILGAAAGTVAFLLLPK